MLEAGEQHRCSKMHDLIWLLCVSLGRLAGGEVREPRTIELSSISFEMVSLSSFR
jgi:hypothetical protein